MVNLMVHVHETPVNIWQRLDLVLQVLRDIMRLPKGHLRWKYYVDLDEVTRTRMIDSTGIDFEDLWVERHCLGNVSRQSSVHESQGPHLIGDEILVVCRSSDTGKEGELLCCVSLAQAIVTPLKVLTVHSARPYGNDAYCDDGGSHRVNLKIIRFDTSAENKATHPPSKLSSSSSSENTETIPRPT